MATLTTIMPVKTYTSEANAIKAAVKKYGNGSEDNLRYFIMKNEIGRFFPVFIGQQAVTAGVHFNFNVVG